MNMTHDSTLHDLLPSRGVQRGIASPTRPMGLWWSFLTLALVFLLTACADDDSFSVSKGNLLTFSKDTVCLDTVFSTIPTPTKDFWVYNRSGDGLRLTSVRLTRGNQTGYRVNVDGTYLSEVSGFKVQHLELRKNDSIRVFVELTSPTNGQMEPQLLEDDLVFTLESGVEQRVKLSAWTWDAELIRNLHVSENIELSSQRPLVVFGGIVVDSAATLRIPAGQTIYFHSGAGIDVYGQLRCEGTAEANVTLRGDRIDNMFDYLPYDFVSGQWNGITFHPSSTGNVIDFTDIHSTFNGIVCDSIPANHLPSAGTGTGTPSEDTETDLKLQLTNSTIHNCQGTGLAVNNCNVEVWNCQITNTLGPCVDLTGGNMVLSGCTIAQFYPFDSNRGPALQFTNGTGKPMTLACVNSLITGYAEDVIMGNQTDTTTTFDYLFASSILRTPAVEDTLRFKDITWENPEDTLTTGEKHFKLVDINKQYYDFHLDSLSTAIGKANPLYALPKDRDGKPRDEAPDIGCYEY